MVTARTPSSKKTTTSKKTVASAALPASKGKVEPKTRAKTPASAVSKPKTARPKQTDLLLDTGTAAKPRAQKKTVTPKIPAKKTVSPEQRYQMIAAAAYFLAERHGFSSGRALDDWIAAEKDVDAMLNS